MRIKVNTLLLFLFGFLLVSCHCVSPNSETDFKFELTSDYSEVVITRYHGKPKDVIVPSE